MLSPLLATIALLQFTAMAFLIIACVTAPVFRQIGLGRNSGTTYGVFGYCETIVGCSKAKGQYSVPAGGSQGDSWLFSKNSREKLGHLLIATPIAAGLNFFAFLSLLMTLISILVSRKNSSRSAIAFFINLFFIIWAFLGATFVCLVCFFTFWPHVTWVTWILIPAAVLPLIEIPTVFFAHIHGSTRGTGLSGRHKQILVEEPDNEFGKVETKVGGNYDDDKPLILPDYEIKNPQPMFQVDTGSSDYDNFCKEKHAPQEKTRELSREDSYDGNMTATNNPQRAVSVIRSESQSVSNRNNSQSVFSAGSSQYSQPVERRTDSRAILEGIIKETLENEEQTSEYSDPQDTESNYTSISQRTAAKSAGTETAATSEQERQQLRQQQRSDPMMQALPSKKAVYGDNIGSPVPQQRPNYGYPPLRPYGHYGNVRGRPNGYMMPSTLVQPHTMPMRNGPYGLPPQQMVMRNGPYGLPPQQMAMRNGPYGLPPQQMAMRNVQYGLPPQQMAMRNGQYGLPSQQMAMRNGPYGLPTQQRVAAPFSQSQMRAPMSNEPPMNTGPSTNNGASGRSHYKPAYKRRVGMQNGFPSTTFDNTYGFR